MKRFVAILAFATLALASTSLAQTVQDDVELIRSVVQTERKAVVAKNMELSEAESEAFWPVYNEYEQAMRKVNDKRVELIRKLAAEYQTLTDEQAEALLQQSFDFQNERVKVRRNFRKKFGKVLAGKRVARFYQIDGKIDAIIDFDIARTIPLVR
jgi:N12 class adenine-specific DNA methylase